MKLIPKSDLKFFETQTKKIRDKYENDDPQKCEELINEYIQTESQKITKRYQEKELKEQEERLK